MARPEPLGYIVIYDDGDCLRLPQKHDPEPGAPKNALCVAEGGEAVAMFSDKPAAKRAIWATYHFNKAHWGDAWTDKVSDYKIVPVIQAIEESR